MPAVDDETIRRALAGDARASRTLGLWLTRELCGFYAKHNGEDVVMDMSQTTVADLLTKLEARAKSEPELLRDGLRRFAVIQTRRTATKRKQERDRGHKLAAHAVEQQLASPPSLEDTYARRERAALVARLFEELPERMRAALELRQDELTYAQIAVRLAVSETTARKLVELATRRLRSEVERARRTRPEFRSSPKAS